MKKYLLLLSIFLFTSFFTFAESPRLIFVEQLTTSHPNSPNIVPISAEFNNIVNSNNDVIPVTIHRNFNVNQFYNDNPDLSKRAYFYVGEQSIAVPSFFVNGTLVQNINNLQSTINNYKNQQTTFTLKVQEDRSGEGMIFVDVFITADSVIKPGYDVYGMLIEEYINAPNVGHPSENEFYYVARFVEPQPMAGEPMIMNPHAFTGHRFAFREQENWNLNQIYAIGWVQNKQTKEVMQVERAAVYNENPDLVTNNDTIRFNNENKNLPQYLDISNPTMGYLDISNITLDNEEDFRILVPSGQKIIYPGMSLRVKVDFIATEAGEYTGNIVINSNAESNDSYSIPVVASSDGVEPDATILTNKGAIDFGTITQYALDTIKVTNTGEGVLRINEIGFTDDYEGDFTIISGGDIDVINPNKQEEIIVKFAPTQETVYFTDFYINSNAKNDKELEVSMTATSEDIVPYAHIYATTKSIDFGEIDQDGATQTIEIENLGNSALEVSAIFLNDNFKVFTVPNNELEFTVAPGETYNFNVIFTPKDNQEYSSSVKLQTNDIYNDEYDISLSGEGVDFPSSVKEIPDNLISIYPNPAIEKLRLETTDKLTEITISTTTGKVVKQIKELMTNEVDVSEFTSGSYIIKLKLNNSWYFKKFIISK